MGARREVTDACLAEHLVVGDVFVGLDQVPRSVTALLTVLYTETYQVVEFTNTATGLMGQLDLRWGGPVRRVRMLETDEAIAVLMSLDEHENRTFWRFDGRFWA